MHIQGAAHLHGPQAINQPHRAGGAQPAKPAQTAQADQLDISREAQAASETLKSDGIRHDRVAEAKAKIAAGFYDNDEILDAALGKLLDDLG